MGEVDGWGELHNESSKRGVVKNMREIWHIDTDLYSCVTKDIQTNEVIITEDRI